MNNVWPPNSAGPLGQFLNMSFIGPLATFLKTVSKLYLSPQAT